MEEMKKIILILIISTLTISGFSQNISRNFSGWNNPNFEENNISSELKIYPNPCTDNKLTIEFNTREISEIRLSNITGKEVYQKKFQFTENKKQIQLNDIPNGIYIIRIITSDQKQVVKKLMVSKK
jgi:hypothetical protein